MEGSLANPLTMLWVSFPLLQLPKALWLTTKRGTSATYIHTFASLTFEIILCGLTKDTRNKKKRYQKYDPTLT